MKVKLKNRLSVKIFLLTLIIASMTLLSSIVGIVSLEEVKSEYQQVKDTNFDQLLKMTELKAQTYDIIHLSTEMLLSKNLNELQFQIFSYLNTNLDLFLKDSFLSFFLLIQKVFLHVVNLQ